MADEAAQQPQAPQRYEYSKPSLSGSITLYTEQAKHFGGNHLDNLQTAMFIIDVVSRKLARNLKTFDHKAVVDAVDKKIGVMEKDIRDETERLEAFLKSRGVTVRANYSSPLHREFAITSPDVQRITSLLVAFDQLIILIDTAWLVGMVDSAEAEKFRVNKSNTLLKLTRSLVGTGQAARTKAYATKAAEASAAEAAEAAEVQKEIELAESKAEASKAERRAAGSLEPDELTEGPDPLAALADEAPQKPAVA